MIELREIDLKNVWELCRLKVDPSQDDFVASNIESIAEAFATRNEGYNALPLGVYDGDTPVGFVMIGYGSIGDEDEPTVSKDAYCLWRLMVDKNFQRRGYGRSIITAVLDHIRNKQPFGASDKIWLSYEPENVVAKMLYAQMGFVENGETCGDEIVAVATL